ncbi:MAG: hypothetical protein DRI34_09835 [Deltaproteobacteria bacterium]|nr:MAG: hypothetical protein DRI34_09835 [Deltaproteobacteria bacterium]
MKSARTTLVILLSLAGGSAAARAGERTPPPCHWNVTVIPAAAAKSSNSLMAALKLTGILLQDGWDVAESGGFPQAGPSGAQDEESAALAMAGVDVIVSFAVKTTVAPDDGGLSVALQIKAYNPRTGETLADVTGTSPRRARGPGAENRAVDDAAARAGTRLRDALRAACQVTRKQGALYRLIFRNPPAGADIKIDRLLRKICRKTSMRKSTRSQVVFNCRSREESIELRVILDKELQAAFPGRKYEWRAVLRNMLAATFLPRGR